MLQHELHEFIHVPGKKLNLWRESDRSESSGKTHQCETPTPLRTASSAGVGGWAAYWLPQPEKSNASGSLSFPLSSSLTRRGLKNGAGGRGGCGEATVVWGVAGKPRGWWMGTAPLGLGKGAAPEGEGKPRAPDGVGNPPGPLGAGKAIVRARGRCGGRQGARWPAERDETIWTNGEGWTYGSSGGGWE